MQHLSLPVLFKGFIALVAVSLPLVLLIILFITIMGASQAERPAFWPTFGKVLSMLYGSALGTLVWLIGVGKLIDASFNVTALTEPYVSWLGMLIPAILSVLAANQFLDHWFQFKQGNYRISFYAFLTLIAYVLVVYGAGIVITRW